MDLIINNQVHKWLHLHCPAMCKWNSNLTWVSVECSLRKIHLHNILLRLWQDNYLTKKFCTTRDLVMVTRFVLYALHVFFCYSDSSPVAFTSLARSCTISDIGGLNSGCRCIMKDSDQIRSDTWYLDPKHFVQIIRWNMPLWYCRLQWKDEEESKFELPGYSGWLCQQNVTILSQNIVHV